jgi:hypothetical protein
MSPEPSAAPPPLVIVAQTLRGLSQEAEGEALAAALISGLVDAQCGGQVRGRQLRGSFWG